MLVLAALPAAASATPLRLVLVGDSITAGQVSAPKGPPYAELVAEALGPAFEIVNLGCGGTSSLDWTRSRGAPSAAHSAIRSSSRS